MKKLPIEKWKTIIGNLKGLYEGNSLYDAIDMVEVIWLDSKNVWCLCYEHEMFEEGFKTNIEAHERMYLIEKELEKDLFNKE